VLVLAFLLSALSDGLTLDIVRNGEPLATIVTTGGQIGALRDWTNVGDLSGTKAEAVAAQVLAEWVQKMTGAQLPVAAEAPPDRPAILIGETAVKAGLKLDDFDSPSSEGIRISVQGNRALIGGQDGTSTLRAACRFLEEFGCRYFFDSAYNRGGDVDLGKVIPRSKDLSIKDCVITEKPKMPSREIWGSNWYRVSLWMVWNGKGGPPMSASHSWATYVPAKEYYEKNPEFFALTDGKRKSGEWLCSSNPQVREVFVQKLLTMAEQNPKGSFSISPPDNHEYCQCDSCRAQDNPSHKTVGGRHVCMTERFLDFYNDIARKVRAQYPDVRLNFYAYADYTEPPLDKKKAEPNLVAHIAPIRFSRYHHIGNPNSPSCTELEKVVDGWGKVVDHLCLRTYNFNLAETTVPFSKLLTWKHDIPYLWKKGLIGINFECFPAWAINGPHYYQGLRLAYDPELDSDRMMDEFFVLFYGPTAGPNMKDYWMSIDTAFQNLTSDTGSYYALHLVYTPDFLAKLQKLLEKAAKETEGDPLYSARVALARKGLEMAWDYIAFRASLNSGHFAKAQEVVNRMSDRAKDPWAFHEHTGDYIRRFLATQVAMPATYTTAPNRLVQMLPDEWRMTYDLEKAGVEKGHPKPDFDDSGWRPVKTYSATLNQQGVPEQFTYMWYRSQLDVPEKHGELVLMFCEFDGDPNTSELYVNGRRVEFVPNKSKGGKSFLATRRATWAYVTEAVKPGRNTVALMLDHRDITENFLGGITRPVVLCEDNTNLRQKREEAADKP
jgi:hypothetical protein